MTELRTFEQLLNLDEPAWPMVQQWANEATNKVEFLPKQEQPARDCLVSMQVTTRSPMGAIIYETGGVLVDNGWIRILGSGCERLPRGMHTWNWDRAAIPDGRKPEAVLIADDAVGGFFALDGGRFGEGKGNIFYFAPDTLEWEDMERGYSDFIHWCFTGDLEDYYEGYRWPNWREDVAELSGDQMFQFFPWPFTEGPPLVDRHRAAIPIEEVWSLFMGNSLLDTSDDD